MTEEAFKKTFKNSPLIRPKYQGITRNLKAEATISAGTSATATQGAGAQDTGGTLGLSYQFEY